MVVTLTSLRGKPETSTVRPHGPLASFGWAVQVTRYTFLGQTSENAAAQPPQKVFACSLTLRISVRKLCGADSPGSTDGPYRCTSVNASRILAASSLTCPSLAADGSTAMSIAPGAAARTA